jgi:asparagine synthase (glutamine-hydrolysing)
MCGIAGMLATGGERVDPRHLHGMAECLHHRGPDDEGYLLASRDGLAMESCRGRDTVLERAVGHRAIDDVREPTYSLGLAHRRLSIIDVSPGGHQPMSAADGTLWLTYNGEIYNYLELRRELQGLGHHFETESDSEVLLRAYEQWGAACLARLNGMWAFAIADLRRGCLFCARDRLGVKPLYYWWNGQTFAFASEIKGLLQLPFVPRVPNDQIVWDFLALGALDHTDQTFYRDIHALDAGEHMTVSFDGRLERKHYWALPPRGQREPHPAKDAEVVRELITDTVRLRLRSDVRVGFCLSGGLDSSTVVAVADKLLDERELPQVGDQLQAFHSAFDDKSVDEREYVQAIIDRSRVVPSYVFPNSDELIADYEQLVRHQDEPFGGPSIYAQYRVIRLAREAGIKVLLDGQGGDELFGGYYQYYGLNLLNLLGAGDFGQAAATLANNSSIVARHGLFQAALRHTPRRIGQQVLLHQTTDQRLIARDFLAAYSQRLEVHLDQLRKASSMGDLLALELRRLSLPRLLRFEDRNSMAFSLESRVPFADDPRLIEFVSALPDSAKIWRGWSKYVLRQSMAGILPDTIRWRKRKLGFSVPSRAWAAAVRGSALLDLLPGLSGRYIDGSRLKRHLEPGGSNLPQAMLWRLLEIAIWERSLSEPAHTTSAREGSVIRAGARLAPTAAQAAQCSSS